MTDASEPARPTYALAETLAASLELEQIDRDLYRAVNTVESMNPRSLYGGQVAAQALQAACLTVAENRFPHSLHGYFLRPGRPDVPVILHVHRDRDGRSFSARHVNAVQNGEVIFSTLASFHVDEESGSYENEPMAEIPGPEGLKARMMPNSLLEVRPLKPPRFDGERFFQSDKLWIRAAHPLPADRFIQAGALVYLSDMGTGFGELVAPGVGSGGSSIDHAMWFHEPVRADEWMLLRLWPGKARGNRGLYHGSLHSRDGRLAAMLSQEVLFRPPKFTKEQIERWIAEHSEELEP
ncbi:MAG: Choloyl-CoA hydrolase [Acidimicrobiia bacterium]|nr:Choloyl-CoA hydrolase [Acidimicrobiia bacterium]